MHLIALLLLQSLALAEPASKQPENLVVESNEVELKLSSADRNVVEITIQNNGQQPLELPYRVTPFEHLVVELQGENGKQHKIEQTERKTDKAEPGTLTIPPGKSKTLSLHACHFYPALGELDQKVTFIARLKHAGKSIESKPLIIDP